MNRAAIERVTQRQARYIATSTYNAELFALYMINEHGARCVRVDNTVTVKW